MEVLLILGGTVRSATARKGASARQSPRCWNVRSLPG